MLYASHLPRKEISKADVYSFEEEEYGNPQHAWAAGPLPLGTQQLRAAMSTLRADLHLPCYLILRPHTHTKAAADSLIRHGLLAGSWN